MVPSARADQDGNRNSRGRYGSMNSFFHGAMPHAEQTRSFSRFDAYAQSRWTNKRIARESARLDLFLAFHASSWACAVGRRKSGDAAAVGHACSKETKIEAAHKGSIVLGDPGKVQARLVIGTGHRPIRYRLSKVPEAGEIIATPMGGGLIIATADARFEAPFGRNQALVSESLVEAARIL